MNRWTVLAAGATLLFAAPAVHLLSALWAPAGEHWPFIQTHWLPQYAFNSLWLSATSALAAAALGTVLAWLETAYDVPLRRLWHGALVLPLAVPPYIAAFVYNHFLGYTGWVQSFLREIIGLPPEAAYLHIPPPALAVFIYVLFLYPYVYLIVLGDLARQDAAVIESARLLGAGPVRTFFRVVVPMSRRSIVAGGLFVAFEVLGDYGLAAYFGIPTLSTGIVQAWFGLYDLPAAERLAACFLIGLIGLIMLERLITRRKLPYTPRPRPLSRQALRGGRAALALLVHVIPLVFGVFIPLAQLVAFFRAALAAGTVHALWTPLGNTVALSVLGAAGITAVATLVTAVARHFPTRVTSAFPEVMLAAYAVPGAVVAVGVLGLLLPLKTLFSFGWMVTDTPLMLLYAYLARYLAVGVETMRAAGERLGRRYFDAARLAGAPPWRAFWRGEAPLLLPAFISSMLLAWIELAKELPLALLLRPFDFETLATTAFLYAGDERLIQAAAPSLVIIGVGALSVIWMMRGKR